MSVPEVPPPLFFNVRVAVDDRSLRILGSYRYRAFMTTTVGQLAEQAMSLPAESRARLADLIVESLDANELGRIDRLWAELYAGGTKCAPGTCRRFQVMWPSGRCVAPCGDEI